MYSTNITAIVKSKSGILISSGGGGGVGLVASENVFSMVNVALCIDNYSIQTILRRDSGHLKSRLAIGRYCTINIWTIVLFGVYCYYIVSLSAF